MVPPARSFGSVRSRSGGAPLVPPAHARVAAQGTRDGRALALARAVAWATGLGPTARLPSSGRATNAIHQRMVPPARSFGSVRSRSGGAPLVPPAHARVAAQGTRDGRALALARPVAWATGLGPTARLPSSGRATNAIHQRMVPPARSFGSVRSRSGGAPLVPPAHARVAAQGTRDGRALALARPVAWATGLGPTARLPSSGRATNAIHQRMVPPARSFGSVRSRSGGAPLVPPAHARVAAQGTRDGRALALARPVAWATGLGPTARLPSSGRATNAIHQRMVPPARSFGSVRSRSGGAPLVPPAHARVAAQGTRDGRALALARPVAWATGLGPTARLPSSGRATNAIHQRMVPPARSFGSVRSRSGGAPLVPPAHARVAAQGTRDGRALALARACGLGNGPGAHRPSAELRTCDQCHSPAHGATRALFWFSAVP